MKNINLKNHQFHYEICKREMNHKWGIKKCKEIIPKYENDEREVTKEILKKLMIKVKNFLLITLTNYSEFN